MLRGYEVRYIPGWDCHGLPIELKVLQSLKQSERQALTPVTLRYVIAASLYIDDGGVNIC